MGEPFEHKLPREKVSEDTIARLRSSSWRVALCSLYLNAGVYMPDAAKKHGATFGFCDADGIYLPGSDPSATHFGWSTDRGGEVGSG